MLNQNRRIALLVETATTYGRGILEGIARYQRTRARWWTYLDETELRAEPPAWLLQRSWDGIICRTTTPALARTFKRKRIPTVDLNDIYVDAGLPRIQTDMEAVGRMAAAHLYERGFRNFAYCGFTNETWSVERLAGVRDQLDEYEATCSVYDSVWKGRKVPNWETDQENIAEWVLSNPKPLGLMACNDVRGQQVLNACQSAGVFVREHVAVVGGRQ